MQQAANRQPGYRSGNWEGRSHPPHTFFHFFWVSQKFQKITPFFNFLKSPGPIELWNFKVISNFNTISINFNMCSTTIILIPNHFKEAMIFRNYFFMVKSTVVQPPLLVRLATVSVWQRAVNRRHGFRSGNSKGRNTHVIILFCEFQKISSFVNFEKVKNL